MQTKLLILWLLSEQPLHGYRIKRVLDDPSMRFWFTVNPGSIYSVLATLVRLGLVIEEAVEKEGRRPERTRYRITAEGRAQLTELLRGTWRELPRLVDPFNVSLAAIPELEPREVLALAHERLQALRDRLIEIDQVAASAPEIAMADRQRALVQAEIAWLQSFISDLNA